MAYSQIQLEAIRQAISDGRLTAQQMHCILLEEISNELNKPKEEVDTEYINACQELLGSLNRSRTAVVSHYEENFQAIQNKMQPRFSFSPCTGWRRLATAMCLALVFLCVGLFIPEGWIITHQTEDEGQYIMQGIETPSGFGSVADAGPALDHIGIYDTTSWQEVVYLMGGKPQVPHWLPSGWSILTYTVSLTDVSSGLTIIYLHDETGGSLLFQFRDAAIGIADRLVPRRRCRELQHIGNALVHYAQLAAVCSGIGLLPARKISKVNQIIHLAPYEGISFSDTMPVQA